MGYSIQPDYIPCEQKYLNCVDSLYIEMTEQTLTQGNFLWHKGQENMQAKCIPVCVDEYIGRSVLA